MMLQLVSPVRRSALLKIAMIDGDTTDVLVYGRAKGNVQNAYTGARNLRPHIGFWAETGVPLAAELMSKRSAQQLRGPAGPCDHRPTRRGGAGPLPVGRRLLRRSPGPRLHRTWRPVRHRVKRTAPVLAAPAAVPEHQWVPAIGMEHTKIALIDYRPGSLPTEGVWCIAWRTRIPVARIPTARARKRRAIPQEAAELAP